MQGIWSKLDKIANTTTSNQTLILCAAVGLTVSFYLFTKYNKLKSRRKSVFPMKKGKTHFRKVKQFAILSDNVLKDVSETLSDPTISPRDARALLPLVTDVRNRGLRLVGRSRVWHNVLARSRIRELAGKLDELRVMELHLRALPKPLVSVEDVLKGRFE